MAGKLFFGEHWSVGGYADVGGGGSDSTWQAIGSVAYRFDRLTINGGYRYMNWEFDEGGNDLMSELTAKGPFLGALYRF